MRSGFKMKGYSYPGKSPVKQKVDLTKTPVGPVAEKKPAKKEKAGDVDFKANFEGGEKVMKIQRDNNMKKRKVAAKMITSEDEEQAYENAQNDYDTDNPTKAQLAKSLAKIKAEKK